jgi:hypothetical protein
LAGISGEAEKTDRGRPAQGGDQVGLFPIKATILSESRCSLVELSGFFLAITGPARHDGRKFILPCERSCRQQRNEKQD